MRRRHIPVRALAGVTGALLTLALIPASGAVAASTRYEAESATISQGTVAADHTGFSGTGFVDYTNVTGSYVEFTVNAASAGTATLALHYANGTAAGRPMDIAVNGTVVAAAVDFPTTGTWDTWATNALTAPVTAGTNKVRATASTATGGPNVDFLDVDLAA